MDKRKVILKHLRSLFLLALVLGCRDKEEPVDHKFLDEVMAIMQDNSINRLTINWTDFRAEVYTAAGNGNTDADIRRGLQIALIELGDHHSFIELANGDFITSGGHPECTGASSIVEGVGDNIGYVRIPGYAGTDNSFAINLQKKIRDQDNEDLIGWIVDLRGNTGGNMWPMLAGVEPILGKGVCGYFIDPLDKATPFEPAIGPENDAAGMNVPDPYTLINPSPKVAVLTDAITASSGEAVTTSFIGRPDTRSFGTSTCGLSTSNRGYPLSDGGMMLLTTEVLADRNKNKKGGPIPPDVTVAGDREVVDAAIKWLNEN